MSSPVSPGMTLKLCVECKHFRQAGFRDPQCALLVKASPVDGTVTMKYCDWARLLGEPCGPEGVLWEAREQKDAAA